MTDTLHVPVSPGEVLDKISILEIKRERIDDAAKRANVERELDLLNATWRDAGLDDGGLDTLRVALREVNERLWDIEDAIRDCERDGDFGDRFVELARAVYRTNDRRAAIKKDINERLGSEIVEEKSYSPY
ncbi:MAG: DUF6165 family protein [Wenzhouxiangellaceae bacterium]|nr:DUF6165 family protein [Wenzhouxiangellaceae bacterium]